MDANKQYLATKLNPILEPLITDILATKPNDPVSFMIDWLRKKFSRGKAETLATAPFEEDKKAAGSDSSSDVKPSLTNKH